MHIDGFYDMCLMEWRDTVDLGVRLAKEHIEAYGVEEGVDKAEYGANYAIECIFESVDMQDAVAYIVASGFTFDCLENTWDSLRMDSPCHVMWTEIRDRLYDELDG